MKTFVCLVTGSAVCLFATSATHAAFIIEASDATVRLGAGNFAYTGAGGTTASYGDVSAGALPATTDAVPTFFTLRHAFGGNGTSDEFTFTYTPASNPDNVSFAAGTLFNSLGAFGAPDLLSTGLSGGTAGIYNVYRIHPNTTNVSGGTTTYQVLVGGAVQLIEQINQNFDPGLASLGKNIGRWELIGSVSVPNATDTVMVKMTPTTSSFVSMRASGMMFEYVAPIPEPGSAAFLALAAASLLRRRR
jgi:uncharacterized protein (TIGR03382 family)